ncbi:MAG: hemolysin III family protein [Deltaproteobacteria bacterium]|nr:hemolysin III family protein [Deltaproteobacteria bacterium]
MNGRIGSARYSACEEIVNGVTHAIGIVLSIIGLCFLTSVSAYSGRVLDTVSCVIFGVSLIFLYSSSTLYHSVNQPRIKAIFRIFDHVGILLLIAGTYTPFTLITLRGVWGWWLFGIVWSLAAAGVVVELSHLRHKRMMSIGLYVLMGWAMIVATKPLFAVLPDGGLLLLFLGGLAYTGGIGFYLWRSLPYHHAIWHLFVLSGSVLHFCCVMFYVVPVNLPV